LDETDEACLLANKPPESVEEIIASSASAIKKTTKSQDVIGLAEVVSRFSPSEIAYMIQETGDSLGEYKSCCQPFELPYSEKLNGQRLMVLHSDSTYAFEKKNKKLAGDTNRNSKVISTLMMDAYGPEGLDIADQLRAIVEVGGIMTT
jgi:hypothetical protein